MSVKFETINEERAYWHAIWMLGDHPKEALKYARWVVENSKHWKGGFSEWVKTQ